MFQYAFAISLQKKYKDEDILIDISNFKGYKLHNGYELKYIFKTTLRIAKLKDIIKVSYPFYNYQLWRIGHRILPKFKTVIHGFQNKKFNPNLLLDLENKNRYFDGYWQSEDFFKGARDEILKEFSFPDFDETHNKEIIETIINSNSVSIHIRRGDYLMHPLFKNICTIEYYRNAIEKIKKLTKVDNFIIFSNDIDWCKENFKSNLKDDNVTFVNWNKGDKSYRDMQLMSLCKHNIIANSSFSWWGAWLNQNPDKIIIAPYKWTNRNIEVQNYLPSDWIRIYNL